MSKTMESLSTESDDVFDAMLASVLACDNYLFDRREWTTLSLRLDIRESGLVDQVPSDN